MVGAAWAVAAVDAPVPAGPEVAAPESGAVVAVEAGSGEVVLGASAATVESDDEAVVREVPPQLASSANGVMITMTTPMIRRTRMPRR